MNILNALNVAVPVLNFAPMEQALGLVKVFVFVILGVIAAALVFLAIYLAYKFFTADDEEKRKNAKGQLIYALVGVVSMVVLIVAWTPISNVLLGGTGAGGLRIEQAIRNAASQAGLTGTQPDTLISIVTGITATVNTIVGVLGILVVLLACWIGFKFFTAEDEEKRKNAKGQLIYCAIGIVVIFVVMALFNTVIIDAMLNGIASGIPA
ncbi:MAG: pilin [Christensenellaceae bacterium]|jgi:cytochrome bd-type quinol oxidase subunit 2|nr:pilin [Christensenellaceae bacterium]